MWGDLHRETLDLGQLQGFGEILEMGKAQLTTSKYLLSLPLG